MAETIPEQNPVLESFTAETQPAKSFHTYCWDCGLRFKTVVGETISGFYETQPWLDHSEMSCPGDDCGKISVLFHDQYHPMMSEIAKTYSWQKRKYCDEKEVLKVRRDILDIKDVKPHRLTARQREYIKNMGAFLQHISVDGSDFGV